MKTLNLFIGLVMLPGVFISQIKTTVSNGNWGNASTWSPNGVPSSSDKIYIYHEVTLDQNFTASDTIFVFHILNLNTNKNLTLNPGTMILVNNANYNGTIGNVGNNAGIVGNFTFQKWITRCDGYSTYGSPFTKPVSDFNWYYCYQCQPSWSNLYYYDETTPGTMDNGYYDNTGGNLERGKGFFYWYSNYSGGQNFPRQISLNGSINFSTDFNFNITRTYSNGAIDDGYNLLANPFPGTIDWMDNAWNKKKISGAIYTWNSCTGTYATFASGVSVNGGSRYIPSMQGFWVQATGNNPSLSVGAGAMTNTQNALLRSGSSNTADYLIKLSLGDDEIAIRLDPTATYSLDSIMDASKFFSPASRLCSSDSLLDNHDYAINTLKDTDQVVSIKINGSGVLQLKGISSFYSQYDVYLKDLTTNDYLPVTENMAYTFTDTTQVTFQKRFELHFVKNISTGVKNQTGEDVKLGCDNDHIYLSLPTDMQTNTQIEMYDLLGKLLYADKYSQQDIILSKPGEPILLRVYNDKQCFVRKIF